MPRERARNEVLGRGVEPPKKADRGREDPLEALWRDVFAGLEEELDASTVPPNGCVMETVPAVDAVYGKDLEAPFFKVKRRGVPKDKERREEMLRLLPVQ